MPNQSVNHIGNHGLHWSNNKNADRHWYERRMCGVEGRVAARRDGIQSVKGALELGTVQDFDGRLMKNYRGSAGGVTITPYSSNNVACATASLARLR
jgi:hypothetical protein